MLALRNPARTNFWNGSPATSHWLTSDIYYVNTLCWITFNEKATQVFEYRSFIWDNRLRIVRWSINYYTRRNPIKNQQIINKITRWFIRAGMTNKELLLGIIYRFFNTHTWKAIIYSFRNIAPYVIQTHFTAFKLPTYHIGCRARRDGFKFINLPLKQLFALFLHPILIFIFLMLYERCIFYS